MICQGAIILRHTSVFEKQTLISNVKKWSNILMMKVDNIIISDGFKDLLG